MWTKWEPRPVVCYRMCPTRPGKTRPQWGVVFALANQELTEASFLCDKTNILNMPCKIHSLSSQSLHLPSSFSLPLSDQVLFCLFQRVWLILIQLADWSHISLDKLSGPQQQQLKVLLLFFNHSLVCTLDIFFLSYFFLSLSLISFLCFVFLFCS